MIELNKESQKYYLQQKDLIDKKYDSDKTYLYKLTEDNTGIPILELYDSDSNLVLKAEYELLGIYNMFNSVWYTAWNVEFVNKKLIQESKKVKDYAKIIKKNFKNYDKVEAEYYYFIANNGNFYVSTENIQRIVKFMLYVTKSLWYIPICSGKDNVTCANHKIKKNDAIKRIEYLLIKKILYF